MERNIKQSLRPVNTNAQPNLKPSSTLSDIASQLSSRPSSQSSAASAAECTHVTVLPSEPTTPVINSATAGFPAPGQPAYNTLPQEPSPGRTNYEDPTMVGQYCDEIIEALLHREQQLHRDPTYLSRQPEVTERMRTILMDWLVDVTLKFKLHPETFFLAVDTVDRYLSIQQGQRSTLQLIGITAMLIAAKHEEIYPPEVKDCEYISANTYRREQILVMERDVVSTLNFRFTVPTVYPFACRMLDVMLASPMLRNLVQFYLESSTMDYQLLQWRPSRIAFAAVVIGQLAEGLVRGETLTIHNVWDSVAKHYSQGATVDEVMPCAKRFLAHLQELAAPGNKFQATMRKFKSSKFGGVSLLALPESIE